jgi:hypothetical protein
VRFRHLHQTLPCFGREYVSINYARNAVRADAGRISCVSVPLSSSRLRQFPFLTATVCKQQVFDAVIRRRLGARRALGFFSFLEAREKNQRRIHRCTRRRLKLQIKGAERG